MIPSAGTGSSGTNYDQTTYGYDSEDRRIRTVSPGGTITRSVFNSRGFPIGTWIGTNDTGATETDPTGAGAAGNNMVQVSAVEYDNNAVGGDGNVTEQTALIDANSANNRVTTFLYDFRNRRTATDGEIDFFHILVPRLCLETQRWKLCFLVVDRVLEECTGVGVGNSYCLRFDSQSRASKWAFPGRAWERVAAEIRFANRR